MPRITFTVGDLEITADAQGAGESVSRSTNKPLPIYSVHFATDTKEDQETVQNFISEDGIVTTSDGQQFKIGQNSYSTQYGSPRAVFTWELFTMEKLQIERLIVGDLELTPYKYEEEFRNDEFFITARVEVSERDYERLRKLPRYFSVVRKGINDQPVEMRFGQVVWSRNGDRCRMNIHLVDKAFDDHGSALALGEPENFNTEKSASRSAVRLKSLVDLLARKGMLTGEEAKSVMAVDEDAFWYEMWELGRVDDLDEFMRRQGE